MSPAQNASARWPPKQRKTKASAKSCLIAVGPSSTARSRRWRTPRAKADCNSNFNQENQSWQTLSKKAAQDEEAEALDAVRVAADQPVRDRRSLLPVKDNLRLNFPRRWFLSIAL